MIIDCKDIQRIELSKEQVLNINNKRMNMYTLDYAIKKNKANIKEMLETIIIRPKYYKFLTEKEKIYGDIRLWSSELLNKIDNEFILKYM
jgi:hypothetical protein